MKKIELLTFVFLTLCIQVLFAQHLKKDGTPDMRYKENKTYSAPSVNYSAPSYSSPSYNSSNSSIHLKSDGTPDKRYSENKTTYPSNVTVTQSPHYEKNSNYSYVAERDSKGRIKRSESAKREFMKISGYPKGRPGYVVDHITPLKRGGCDCPDNMQWQTKADAKAKDKWE